MQYDAVNKIVVYLMDKHNLLPENIIRHLDISGDRGKRDVSDNFWNRFHKTYKDYQNYL
jgi:N-acetyl-anhydromuramyl-L-alanine amidase AmpD